MLKVTVNIDLSTTLGKDRGTQNESGFRIQVSPSALGGGAGIHDYQSEYNGVYISKLEGVRHSKAC
jgi:hypothetical protein